MRAAQILPGADAEKLPTACSTEREPGAPKVRGWGISEVQKRAGTRVCSPSKCWPSRAASQVQETGPTNGTEYRCHSPSSTQWPQPGDLPRACLCPGCSHRCVQGQRAFLGQPPAPVWEVWWGPLPQPLWAAGLGLALTGSAPATLYM